jgi:hypothetical protein
MEENNEFSYTIKAPDGVLWNFIGRKTSRRYGGQWAVGVTQEYDLKGISFTMQGNANNTPHLIDVFSAFQAKIGDLLNPIAWDIHYHRNSGMK